MHGTLQVPLSQQEPDTMTSRHSINPVQMVVFRSVNCTKIPPESCLIPFLQMVDMVPDITAPTARYPFEVCVSTKLPLRSRTTPQITLHQGAIEAMFLDSMRTHGVEVDRAIVPTSIHISKDPKLLQDPASHPVQVSHPDHPRIWTCQLFPLGDA